MYIVVFLAGHLVAARHLLEHYGYLALLLALVIEYLVFFIPGETFLIVAAAYSATGRLNLFFVILAGAAGAAIGANNAYWIGRRGGRPFLFAHAHRFRVGLPVLERLERFFHRHGAKAIFWLRFVTVLRILVGYFAGIHEVGFRTFTAYNILGAVVWASLISLLGYAFAHNLSALRHLMTDTGLIVLAAIAVAAFIGWKQYERKGRRREAEAPATTAVDRVL
jgi:membrane protein DedA with SNARE-associated domain